MKILRVISVVLSALLIMTVSVNASAQKKGKKIEEITFKVENMHCASCQKKLDAKLPFESGVKDYKSNLKERTIWFKYDASKTDKSALQAAIQKNGFSAQELGK